MRNAILFLGITICLIGCQSSVRDFENQNQSFSFEIVDSLQIDYLGDLWIIDYDSSTHQYLAWGNGDREVLVLNESGQVTSSFFFPTDGPDAIPSWINPIGINNNAIEFIARPNGFYRFDFQGNKVWDYKMPSDFYYLNGVKGDPFFWFENEIGFLRPEKGELDWENDFDGLIKKIYSSPILEIHDTIAQTSRFTMPFPPKSIYKDGNFHFWTFPTVERYGSEWILYFRNELKFWIYEEIAGEVIFQREVSLDVSDAVLEKGVPFENADD